MQFSKGCASDEARDETASPHPEEWGPTRMRRQPLGQVAPFVLVITA